MTCANPSRPGRIFLFRQGIAHADQIVGDDTEADPALHAGLALVAAAVETVAALDHADAPLAARAPFLTVAEPAFLLLALALEALGRPVGNTDALDTLGLGRGLVVGGVEARIRRHKTRRAPQCGLMFLDGRDEQVRVGRALIVDLVVDHDLVLRFLQFDQLAELVGLAGLPLADDLCCRLEQAEDLGLVVRVAVEDARSCLGDDLPHARYHLLELAPEAVERGMHRRARRVPLPIHDLPGEALGLPDHAARGIEQIAIGLVQPVLALRANGASRAPNLHDAVLHAARAVAQLAPRLAGDFGDLLHDPGQHADAIAQQAAVGGIVDVGLDHCGV